MLPVVREAIRNTFLYTWVICLKTLPQSVLVSYRCYNKGPQNEWLRTIQVYYLTALEVRSLKWVSLAKMKMSAGLGAF